MPNGLQAAARVRRPVEGQAMVEFALTFTIFIFMVLLILDFGRAIWYSNAISNAAREGARHAIVRTRADSEVVAYVRDRSAGVPLTAAHITIAPAASRIARQPVTVSISYRFEPVTPMISNLLPGGAVQLSASSSMLVEY